MASDQNKLLDPVDENLAGQQLAHDYLAALKRHTPNGNELAGLLAYIADNTSPKLIGFCRVVQKRLEVI